MKSAEEENILMIASTYVPREGGTESNSLIILDAPQYEK
jgi:hypothetical protein